ncbi:MAG: hypothetical protein AAFZ91_00680 [Pseudomonadota bacterium]
MRKNILACAAALPLLAGCLAVTAVSMTGSALVSGAKLAGKTVYYAGKGVYQVGKLTVNVADGVLDGTERTLRLTILTANAAGAVTRTTREISAASLDAELAALERTEGVIEVFVEEAD